MKLSNIWKWAYFYIWFSLRRAKKCFDESDIDLIVLQVFCVCVLEKIWVSCMLLRNWNNSTCCSTILRVLLFQPLNYYLQSVAVFLFCFQLSPVLFCLLNLTQVLIMDINIASYSYNRFICPFRTKCRMSTASRHSCCKKHKFLWRISCFGMVIVTFLSVWVMKESEQ